MAAGATTVLYTVPAGVVAVVRSITIRNAAAGAQGCNLRISPGGTGFVAFWTRGGQTLPMKTWRIRLVRHDGAPVGVGRAVHRYLLAVLGLAAAGVGFAWALVDRDRQFLHDRLAGTALVEATTPKG